MTEQPAHPEHAIRCPWCHAPPGTRCTTPRGRKLTIPSHDARLQGWAHRPKETA
ncbi:zinc finger domain-containing protein [Streptomyces hygroscopicus]|uniref:zinc finger domain-containing protein n=1 Tax=Streptomyces hygroscopicus TaxID=1912 RepID=UPI0037A604C7